MRNKLSFALVLMVFFAGGCKNKPADKAEKWESLFNGKDLTGWETYIGPKYDTVLNKWDTIPIGLNADPLKVFSVTNLDGEKVIRISGEQFGGINTLHEFENYHLQFQFKWGTLQWHPRKKGKKDSGLMYHAVGPQGADNGFWMRSHEFQIQEGDCGDYWACAGAFFDITSRMEPDSSFIYDLHGKAYTFSTVSKNGRNCRKFPDAEKPTGEWNTIDLFCLGDSAVHMMNGMVTMILQNSGQLEDNGEIPLLKGKIQIQSEGAELFLRNIQITPISELSEFSSK